MTRARLWALIAGVVAVVVAVAVVVVVVDRNKPAAGGEVFLESAGSTGKDPFTPSVATPQPPGTVAGPGPAAAPAGAPQSQPPQPPKQEGSQSPNAVPAALRTVSGGEPGLYGGSRNLGTCDTGLLVNFLGQNPDKGAAWAGVLGIAPTQIRDYVSTLTQVVLRGDTRVTNHGFANGKAYPLQSVLQAGTAVLVDKFGTPRVRCECGNPLLAPQPQPSPPNYIGQRWYWFSETTIVVVSETILVINYFILFDWGCGCYFGRLPGGGPPGDGPPCVPPRNTPPVNTPPVSSSEPYPPSSELYPPVSSSELYPPSSSELYPPSSSQLYPPSSSELYPPSSQYPPVSSSGPCPPGTHYGYTEGGGCVPDVSPSPQIQSPVVTPVSPVAPVNPVNPGSPQCPQGGTWVTDGRGPNGELLPPYCSTKQ
jgi:hypothetical protein